MAERHLIESRFKKGFATYEDSAFVQARMARLLTDMLKNHQSDFDKIMEIGSGTGLLTKEIVNNFNFKEFIANDLIADCEEHVRKISDEILFFYEDAQNFNINKKFDLIMSNATFQWFDDLAETLRSFHICLKNSGYLAFSTFGVANFKEIKDTLGLSLNYKPKDEICSILSENFDILDTMEWEEKLEFKEVLDVLKYIKQIGTNSLIKGLWTKSKLEKFVKDYENLDTKGIFLTYNPILIVARKK
ncbi:MAG: malonyl-ACP O-methyltransferase BioC [Candidatus Gastranaerophilales bacterium]|nr:malonyl-ACP O-methyltransferase BioC [Candidatus Gastranaerophilales bacterium]